MPGPDGRRLELVLADPARGQVRWERPAPTSPLTWGAQNLSFYGSHLTATGLSLELSRVGRLGPLQADVGLTSLLLVQRYGDLVSSTSAFASTGIAAHLMWPGLRWGAAPAARQLGPYIGGSANLLVSMPGRIDPTSF